MKLMHADFAEPINIHSDVITEWIIESPELFSKYLYELTLQSEGTEGGFVLSTNEKELIISKTLSIIIDPITININDKKILSKIYNELQKTAINGEFYIRTKEITYLLQQYFLELEHNNDFMLSIENEIDLQGLFKLLGVHIEYESLSYFERFLQYIKIQNLVLSKKLVMLVNIRSYLTECQLQELFLFVRHNEIPLLLLEGMQRDFTNNTIKYIIDKDKCFI